MSEISIDAHKILQEINFERLAGSEGERKCAEIFSKYLRELGLEPKLVPFELVSFKTGTAKITVEGKDFPVHPFGLNENAEIEGELIFLENPEVLRYNKGAFKNKIVLSVGYARKLADLVKENELKAYCAIGAPMREQMSLSHRQQTYKDGYTSMMTVNFEVGAELSKLSCKQAKITIIQEVEKKTAYNIEVDIKGKGFDNNVTYVVGHYDTVALSPGASDNGGGSVCLIKVAEYFAENQPQRDLKIIFFSGEELGLLGSQAFVEANKEEIQKRAGLVVNIDVTGDDLGIDNFIVLGTKELMGYVSGISKEAGLMFGHSLNIYSSDNMPFSVYEIPSVNICRAGGKASYHIHTKNDDVQFTSSRGLKNTYEAGILLLERILNAKIYPIQREIDKDLKEKIEKYVWNLNYTEPKLQWEPNYKK